MHEFSLADDLLRLARDEARKAGVARLDRIIVRVGGVSGVNIEALEFAFGFLREQDEITITAELVVERVPGRGRCSKCGLEVELESYFLYCPECKTPTVEITQGREFLLVRLEGEEKSDREDIAGLKPEVENG